MADERRLTRRLRRWTAPVRARMALLSACQRRCRCQGQRRAAQKAMQAAAEERNRMRGRARSTRTSLDEQPPINTATAVPAAVAEAAGHREVWTAEEVCSTACECDSAHCIITSGGCSSDMMECACRASSACGAVWVRDGLWIAAVTMTVTVAAVLECGRRSDIHSVLSAACHLPSAGRNVSR